MNLKMNEIDGYDKYLLLVKQLPLEPLASQDEYDRARSILSKLDGRRDLAEGEQIYCDAMFKLVSDYEKKNFECCQKVPPKDLVTSLMENRKLGVEEVNAITECDLSEFLSGRTDLSIDAAMKLAEYFAMVPEAFLPD